MSKSQFSHEANHDQHSFNLLQKLSTQLIHKVWLWKMYKNDVHVHNLIYHRDYEKCIQQDKS